MTKVYIAAPYSTRDQAISVMQLIRQRGHEVTSRWLTEEDTLSDEHARKDLADVARADILLALNPDTWSGTGTGGRHVELGYALALKKRIILLGVRSNIFHYLDCVMVVTSLEEVLDLFGDQTHSSDDVIVTRGQS